MADNRKADGELFFWIKTGRGAENPIPKKPEKIISSEKRVNFPAEKPTAPIPQGMNSDTARAGLQPGWIRASFIVREEYLAKLKQKAYWDRKPIKDILDEMLGVSLSGESQDKSTEKEK